MQLSNLTYSQFLETIPDAAIVVNREGKIVLANSQAYVLFGYQPGELQEQSIQALVPETKRKIHVKLIESFFVSPKTRPMGAGRELVGRRKDSSEFSADIMLRPAEMGGALLAVCIVRDITQRKQAEAQNQRFGRVLDASLNEIYLFDTVSLRFVMVNQGARQNLGYTMEELRNLTPLELKPEFNRETFEALLAPLREGREPLLRFETVHRRKDSTIYPVEVHLQLARTEHPPIFVAIIADITERKHHERELETVVTIGAALRTSQTRAEMLSIILDELLALLKADGAAFALRDPASGETVIELAAGEFAPAIGEHIQPGQGVSGHVILTGQPYLNNDARNEHRFSKPSLPGNVRAVACAPLIAHKKTIGALWIGRTDSINEHDARLLTAIADMAANAVHRVTLYEETQRDALELALAYDSTIEGWSHALDLRDKETEGHTLRVTEMTLRLARAAGMTEEELVHVRRGALLHDIGKMGIPDTILLKSDKLTDEEWALMRQHPTLAYELLLPIAYLRPALDIPYCHHEKWDGSGYPQRQKGEQIPLAARLFAVVDVWDALRSDRPYRQGWPEDKVLEHIRAQVGTHFDPGAVELFLRVTSENTQEH